jgi:hypothetical protein
MLEARLLRTFAVKYNKKMINISSRPAQELPIEYKSSIWYCHFSLH